MNNDRVSLKAPFRNNRNGAFSFVRSLLKILTATFVGTVVAFCQSQEARQDTVAGAGMGRHYVLPEFIVSANRWKSNVTELPSSISVLTGADLLNTGGESLAAALEGAAGVYVKSYGGPGSVSTTSIRGMGAEHTLVLLDGMRLNNARDGQVDFGLIPVRGIERIEVLRGGFSSVYGADAIGGVINIVTRRPAANPGGRGEIAVGSFSMQGGDLAAEFRIGGAGFLLSAHREAGEGNYAFSFKDGVTSSILQRQNADYAINQLQLLTDFTAHSGVEVRWSNTYNWSDRGSPGAVLSPSSTTRARLRDAGFQSHAAVEWQLKPTLNLRFSSLFNTQRRIYRDAAAGGGSADQESDYADRTVTLTPHVRYLVNSWTTVHAGMEYAHAAISSDQLDPGVRTQFGLFLSTDHSFDYSREFFYQVNLYPSIRYDRFTGHPGVVNPRLGINLGLWKLLGLRAKASVGKSYRAPSFVDLYWKNSGNPFLRPERSVGIDAGLSALIPVGEHLDIEGSYFNMKTTDRIVWTPAMNGLWSPTNVAQVISEGVELTAALGLFDGGLTIRGSYTNSDTRKSGSSSQNDQTLHKQLPYLPHETGSVSMTVRMKPFVLSMRQEYTGFRYATESNDPAFILSPFQKTDITISARILEKPFVATAWLSVLNLFDSDYEIFPNFPMPLRSMSVRMSVDF